ncbi:phosphogluconate dehydrogenase [Streptomyces clavuligerus]|uniref:Putative dehydrogenase n=2 Tax=Streptomyces clavuligerus TaxID=1901 RepID=E2Q021_STRCL|nr:phosphogluconate dehydrogenase [Streptomyces clavuligerus]EFG08440.1 Putative dehydrogenase [Streptomyces clavuligerus]
MGAPLAGHAVALGHRVLWVSAGRSARSRHRAERAGLVACDSLGRALEEGGTVLSVCPPHAAEEVAAQVAAAGWTGIYVEANAISPQRTLRIARSLPGCAVVDGAIIGPPPSGGRSARLYLAGATSPVARVGALFAGTGVVVRAAGEELGAASALKMAFAGYQKSARALAGVAHALAAHHGVGRLLLEEAHTTTSAILSDPGYLPSVAARAWRWGPEMGEIADTLRAAGLPPEAAEATGRIYERWSGDKDQELSLDTVLSHLYDLGDAAALGSAADAGGTVDAGSTADAGSAADPGGATGNGASRKGS